MIQLLIQLNKQILLRDINLKVNNSYLKCKKVRLIWAKHFIILELNQLNMHK